MNKKTMIIAGCSIVGILVLLILFVWLLSVFKKNYVSYEKAEEKIVEATKKYYKTYPELLPVDEGRYTLQYSALVEGKFIKPLNQLLKDGDNCSAEINVYKTEEDYDYIPKLYCGTNYQTTELFQRIINDNPVTTSGSGLYQRENGSYYFRGKIENNYVALGTTGSGKRIKDILWKIIGIDENGYVKIISQTNFTTRSVFDNRYNVTIAKTYGYNDFNESMLKDFLVKMDKSEDFLTPEEKAKLVRQPLCYGKRKAKEKVNDGSIECSQLSEPLYFGTITPYEYISASLDENCNKVGDKSCGNFNYLFNSEITQWTITATPENNYEAYTLSGAIFELAKANVRKKIYPTAYINSRVLYRSGTGTIDDPYRIIVK